MESIWHHAKGTIVNLVCCFTGGVKFRLGYKENLTNGEFNWDDGTPINKEDVEINDPDLKGINCGGLVFFPSSLSRLFAYKCHEISLGYICAASKF